MSRRLEELALRYRCEYCLAGIDVWCRTRIGARATMLHTVRTDPVRLAWLDGHDVGVTDTEERIEFMARPA